MIGDKYHFNPLNHGYEPISEFPELKGLYGKTTFIKVIAIAGKECNKPTYWYSACRPMGMTGDERWEIRSSAYQEGSSNDCGHTDYMGLISTENFAYMLLAHIFGTTKNNSVMQHGIVRRDQSINHLRLESHQSAM
tara:strand:+ start:501 stop:908 length:408 start_codon:yes stop_codon:yes gene_type:complete